VLQYNKRDLPGVLPIEELDEALNFRGLPAFPAAAVSGDGVFDTLRAVSQLVLQNLSRGSVRRFSGREFSRRAGTADASLELDPRLTFDSFVVGHGQPSGGGGGAPRRGAARCGVQPAVPVQCVGAGQDASADGHRPPHPQGAPAEVSVIYDTLSMMDA
jgi:hypothetical protein